MKLIDGVSTKQLKPIPDERGRVMEILRNDDEIYKGFGQVYLTTVYPEVIKAWHYHKKQTDYISCILGMMKLVMYDCRDDSPTKGLINELYMGEHNPIMVVIPPCIYHGFKCISTTEAVVINVPNQPYNHQSPDEYRLDPKKADIPYDWARKDG